jgi:hypothetical protein
MGRFLGLALLALVNIALTLPSYDPSLSVKNDSSFDSPSFSQIENSRRDDEPHVDTDKTGWLYPDIPHSFNHNALKVQQNHCRSKGYDPQLAAWDWVNIFKTAAHNSHKAEFKASLNYNGTKDGWERSYYIWLGPRWGSVEECVNLCIPCIKQGIKVQREWIDCVLYISGEPQNPSCQVGISPKQFTKSISNKRSINESDSVWEGDASASNDTGSNVAAFMLSSMNEEKTSNNTVSPSSSPNAETTTGAEVLAFTPAGTNAQVTTTLDQTQLPSETTQGVATRMQLPSNSTFELEKRGDVNCIGAGYSPWINFDKKWPRNAFWETSHKDHTGEWGNLTTKLYIWLSNWHNGT